MADPTEVAKMDNHRHRKEFMEAMSLGSGQSERISPTLDKVFYYYAVRIDGADGPLGAVRASLSADAVESHVAQVRRIIWACAILAGCLAGLTSYFLVSRMHGQIAQLASAADAVADGRPHQPVSIYRNDELGHLASSIQRMTTEIDRRICQLHDRNDQLAAVLGGMIEGVIAIDRHSRILFANDAAARMLQCSAKSTEGRTLSEITRDDTVRRSVQQAISSCEVVQAEITTLKDATSTVSMSVTPLPGKPCAGAVIVLHDTTESRRLESLRKEFVSNVSRDLKSLLSSIKTYASTLRNGMVQDADRNLQSVARIEEQANQLHDLITDVISLARIESGQMALEMSDILVDDAVEDCLDQHRETANAKQIELLASPHATPVHVRVDAGALRQILDHLVGNAIKYTPPHGTVRVQWSPERESVVLKIIDTGIGISETDQARIFERFFRVEKVRSQDPGGTGLGLSIVSHLAQFLGGSVGVQSQTGKGSTFWVRLPLAKLENAA
jgi:two-component system phosphate regulon sensor histidine kinase PhoR